MKPVEKLISARFAADVMGVPTLILARTDAEAANLITSDYDENDKPFLTGERTQEGFYRVKNGLSSPSPAALPTPVRRPGVVRNRRAGYRLRP